MDRVVEAFDGEVRVRLSARAKSGQTSGIEFTPHDLRRTGATNLARLGIDDVIIAKILNHKWADCQVASIYNRNSRLPEMTVAMERWGEKLRQIVTGDLLNLPGPPLQSWTLSST